MFSPSSLIRLDLCCYRILYSSYQALTLKITGNLAHIAGCICKAQFLRIIHSYNLAVILLLLNFQTA